LKQISHVVIHCVCASNVYKHSHDHYMNTPSSKFYFISNLEGNTM